MTSQHESTPEELIAQAQRAEAQVREGGSKLSPKMRLYLMSAARRLRQEAKEKKDQ